MDISIMGYDYTVERDGENFHVMAEDGECHTFAWDGVRLVGPSYSRVPSEFRAHLAAHLKQAGWLPLCPYEQALGLRAPSA